MVLSGGCSPPIRSTLPEQPLLPIVVVSPEKVRSLVPEKLKTQCQRYDLEVKS